MRRLAFALGGALALAGCPLPQPLPDYPAGSITPPRILTDPIFVGNSPIIFVPAGCATTAAPQYPLNASVSDSNTIEPIEARWFVNYDVRYPLNRMVQQQETIQPNADTANLVRPISAFRFEPYGYPAAPDTPGSTVPNSDPNVLRIVELVVSNGFDPSGVETSLPNRKPLPGFETQVHRWVFLTAGGLPCPGP